MNSLQTREALILGDRRWQLHRLDRLGVDRLPFTLKVLLENLLRHEDGRLVTAEQVEAVRPTAERRDEVVLHPTRVFLHDTNGVPALVDLAAIRDALAGLGGDPQAVSPVIPAELVADHSVIADVFGRPDARDRNVELEYARVPRHRLAHHHGQRPGGPGLGDRRHRGRGRHAGQSLSLMVPPVVGFRLTGELPPGATATDLVLTITELLRGHGVVGKFVEFHGPGVTRTSVADRVTIANMSPAPTPPTRR
jgi:aconitate hydratase